MSEIVKFNPSSVSATRDLVSKQIEQMQASKFVNLPDNFKESVFFAMDKLSSIYEIEKVQVSDISKTLINMFDNRLDFRKNHCYFFVQNDKNSPTGKSLRFGWQYQGKIHVAKEQCGVSRVTPVLVSEGDEFISHYQDGAFIIDKHVPTFGDKITGGYCVVEFNDGYKLIRYYTRAELDKRRGASKAPKGNFWAWEREMFEKTLINATIKRIIETSSDTRVDDSFYQDEPINIDQREVVDAEIIVQDEPEPTKEPQQQSFKLE